MELIKNETTRVAHQYKLPNKITTFLVTEQDRSNCKVLHIHSITAFVNALQTVENPEELIEKIFKGSAITIFFTTHIKSNIDVLKEYFEFYYIITVPIGYGDGEDENPYQYHCLMKNKFRKSEYLRDEECKLLK